MKKILSFILFACCAVPVMAQWQMQPTGTVADATYAQRYTPTRP